MEPSALLGRNRAGWRIAVLPDSRLLPIYSRARTFSAKNRTDDKSLNELVNDLRKGPEFGRVDDLHVSRVEMPMTFDTFKILQDGATPWTLENSSI